MLPILLAVIPALLAGTTAAAAVAPRDHTCTVEVFQKRGQVLERTSLSLTCGSLAFDRTPLLAAKTHWLVVCPVTTVTAEMMSSLQNSIRSGTQVIIATVHSYRTPSGNAPFNHSYPCPDEMLICWLLLKVSTQAVVLTAIWTMVINTRILTRMAASRTIRQTLRAMNIPFHVPLHVPR